MKKQFLTGFVREALRQSKVKPTTGYQQFSTKKIGLIPIDQKVKEPMKTSNSQDQPFVCGSFRKQYKNVRSQRTNFYQIHKKVVPEGSSHDLHGKLSSKVIDGKNPQQSAGTDRSKSIQRFYRPDLGIDEEISVNKDQSRNAPGSNTGPPERPPQGRGK